MFPLVRWLKKLGCALIHFKCNCQYYLINFFHVRYSLEKYLYILRRIYMFSAIFKTRTQTVRNIKCFLFNRRITFVSVCFFGQRIPSKQESTFLRRTLLKWEQFLSCKCCLYVERRKIKLEELHPPKGYLCTVRQGISLRNFWSGRILK